jgi:hypothetical protein
MALIKAWKLDLVEAAVAVLRFGKFHAADLTTLIHGKLL